MVITHIGIQALLILLKPIIVCLNTMSSMDPVTSRALDDLKELLREKVITLAEWRVEVQALRAATPASQPVRNPAPVMEEKHNSDEPRVARTRKLSDAEVDEVLDDLLADDAPELEHKDEAPEEHEDHKDEHEEHKEGPTRLFHAEFAIQLFAQRADGTLRTAERRVIRGWAHLTDEQVDNVRDAQHNAPVMLSPGETLPIATAFGWGATHEHLSSEGNQLTITVFDEMDEDHEAGAWMPLT